LQLTVPQMCLIHVCQVVFRLGHSLTNILLINDPVAVVRRVGFMPDNLFCNGTGHPCPIHVPGHCAPGIVEKTMWHPREFAGLAPSPTIIPDLFTLPMKDVGTGFYTLCPPPVNDLGDGFVELLTPSFLTRDIITPVLIPQKPTEHPEIRPSQAGPKVDRARVD
jgi:hypothetical protein